jgi:branched-chain amino acid transport system substrate-binding protein
MRHRGSEYTLSLSLSGRASARRRGPIVAVIVSVPGRSARLVVLVAAAAAAGTTGCAVGSGAPSLRIGAIFPLAGSAATGAAEEYQGARLAADMVNEDGGVGGRRITFDVRDAEAASAVQGAADSLRRDGVVAVIGAYSSQLSIPAAAAVARDGMVYWESGAVADQVTGQGHRWCSGSAPTAPIWAATPGSS